MSYLVHIIFTRQTRAQAPLSFFLAVAAVTLVLWLQQNRRSENTERIIMSRARSGAAWSTSTTCFGDLLRVYTGRRYITRWSRLSI